MIPPSNPRRQRRPAPSWLKRAAWVGAVIMLGAEFALAVSDVRVSYAFWAGMLWVWIIHMPGRELRGQILEQLDDAVTKWGETLGAWQAERAERLFEQHRPRQF